MEAVWKFVIWFAVSLVSVFALVTNITNPFTISFIIGAVIAVLGARNEQ